MLSDLTLSIRSLSKTPTFTLAAIATLAIGIGSTVAIVSVVQAVLVEPLPYPEPDRLTVFWAEWRDRGIYRLSHTGNDFREYQRETTLFEGIAALGSLRQNLGGVAEPVQVQVGWISENFFRVMKVSPALGRDFTNHEPPDSVILGYGIWQSQFAGAPEVLGRVVELDETPFTVVGVLPRGFRLWHAADVGIAMDIDLWKPADPVASPGRWKSAELDQSTLRILGRMKPAVALEQAQAEMEAVSESLRKRYPDHERVGFHVDVKPLHREVVGHAQKSLEALLGAVGLVLLVACANVSGLLLVRAQHRESEMAMRAALGATTPRIVRKLLVESLLLGLGGGLLGILLGSAGVKLLLSLDSGNLPRVQEVKTDATVLAVALATILGATLLFGLLPAIRSASPDLRRFLSQKGTPPSAPRRLTEVLVVSEIAISLVLLVGAGLLLRSFVALREIRPGFDSGGLLTFSISLPSRSYPPPVATWEFLQRLEKRLTELPGVASAGTVWPLPLEGQKFFGYYRTTDVATEEGTLPVADFRISSPAYLETMGARLLSGRYLREDDSNAVVVDRTLAERNWPDGKALGQKVWVQPESAPVEMQVVGVTENIRHADLTRDGRETIYLPARVFAWSDFELALVVRASDPEAQVAPVRKALAELDPKIPMAKVKTADECVEDAMAANRLAFLLAALFAGAALLLSGVGLYGVMAYGFERRRREMGLRMALGADGTAVAALVLGNGFKLALRGIGIGAGGTYLLRGSLAGLLYGVEPSDPWTLGTVAGVVGLTSLAGSLGPLRRALRVDPSTALRSE